MGPEIHQFLDEEMRFEAFKLEIDWPMELEKQTKTWAIPKAITHHIP